MKKQIRKRVSHFKNYLAVIPKVIFNKDLLLEEQPGKDTVI